MVVLSDTPDGYVHSEFGEDPTTWPSPGWPTIDYLILTATPSHFDLPLISDVNCEITANRVIDLVDSTGTSLT